MVDRQEIGQVPDSDDEDAKKDLELKRKINLEKGRRVAWENQRKGSRIWHTIKHMSEDRRLHIRDVLDIAAKENLPQAHPSAAEQQVSATLTPLKSSTASSSNSIWRYHQKKNRLALHKKKTRAYIFSIFRAPELLLMIFHFAQEENKGFHNIHRSSYQYQ